MYVVEYCDNPNMPSLSTTNQTFSDDFENEYESKGHELDRFYFLIDMHTIIESCAEDLLNIRIRNRDDFWEINKVLLNFVNAVYGYKEYVNSYEPSLKVITEKYYNCKQWYRFICDFRNYIIHQTILIKDYAPFTSNIFINIEEVATALNSYDYPKAWQRKNAEEFSEWITNIKDISKLINGKYYLNMKEVVKSVVDEMKKMKDEVLFYAFQKGVLPELEWLIDLIPLIDGKYKYAFIVNKEKHLVFEPNYSLEDFYRRMIRSLGNDSQICESIESLLSIKKYDYFYDGECNQLDFKQRYTDSKV